MVFQNNVFTTAYYPLSAQDGTAYPTSPPPFNVSGGNIWTANTWYDGGSAGTTINPP